MVSPIGLCPDCKLGKVYFEKKTERYICSNCHAVILEPYEDIIELDNKGIVQRRPYKVVDDLDEGCDSSRK